MKSLTPLTLAVLIAGGSLAAQAPATPAPEAQTQPAPVAQAEPLQLDARMKALEPQMKALQAQLRFPEALKLFEGLLPAEVPAYDGRNTRSVYISYTNYKELAQAYNRARILAHQAGDWEKALSYAKKAQKAAQDNAAETKKAVPLIIDYYKRMGDRAREVLNESQNRIKELKAKVNRDPGEQQELDLALGVENEIVEGEKWQKFYTQSMETAGYYADKFDRYITDEEAAIKALDDAISSYKAGKGDKAKFVEATAAYPQNLAKQYPDLADRMAYMLRLNFLAPGNKKLEKEIDATLAKAPKG